MRPSPSSTSSSEFGGIERSTSVASKSDEGEPTDSSRLYDGSVRSAEGRRMLTACLASMVWGSSGCCIAVAVVDDKQCLRGYVTSRMSKSKKESLGT